MPKNYFTPEHKLEEIRLRVGHRESFLTFWNKFLKPRDRKRFGGDPNVAYVTHGTIGIAVELWGVLKERAALDLARLLQQTSALDSRWLMRELGESADDPDEVRERIVPKFDLVVIDGERELFWKKNRVEVEWPRKPGKWSYFIRLAQATKMGIPLSREMIKEGLRADYLSKTKSTLTNPDDHFPTDLGNLILAAGTNQQILKVDRGQIRIFEQQADGTVREWTGEHDS